jgi:hypothetical protein
VTETGRRFPGEKMRYEWLLLEEKRTVMLANPNRQNAAIGVDQKNYFEQPVLGLCGSPGLTVEMSALCSEADVTGFAS